MICDEPGCKRDTLVDGKCKDHMGPLPPMPFISGRCATCKHWRAGEDSHAAFPVAEGWGCCALVAEHEPQQGALAYAQDYEGFHAWLITAAEFGCPSHEAD